MRRDFRIFALAGIGLTAACATVPAPGDPAEIGREMESPVTSVERELIENLLRRRSEP